MIPGAFLGVLIFAGFSSPRMAEAAETPTIYTSTVTLAVVKQQPLTGSKSSPSSFDRATISACVLRPPP